MNRNIFSWLIYDVANSFLTVSIGGFFLAQWVILDNKFDDIWYGGMVALATIFVLVTSPFLGSWSDKLGRRLPFIKWLTVTLIILDGTLVLFALSGLSNKTRVLIVLGITLLIQYVYQLSLIFYNTLLEKVSTQKNRGEISGLGEALNYLGWIVATAFLILFSTGKITLFGEPGRAQAFLPAFVFFALFSLPMLFWFREPVTKGVLKTKTTVKDVYNKTIRGFKDLFKKNKNVALFLVAFSLISDAILTVQVYFAVVMEALFKINDAQKFPILGLMFLVTIIACYLLGKISDRIGNKIIILLSCIDLIAIFSWAFLTSATYVLYLLAIFAGIGWAGYYVASRALLIKISPPEQLGEYFGFYSTFQRFASVAGPLIWGIVTLLLRNYGAFKYRVAGIALVLVMVIGTLLFKSVREEKALV